MADGPFGDPDYPHVPTPTALLLDETLTDGSVRLWALLFQYASTGGGNPFEMTVGEMMELSGASKMSVIKRKKELVDAGWLQETALRGLGRTNIYAIVTPGQSVPAPSGPQQDG